MRGPDTDEGAHVRLGVVPHFLDAPAVDHAGDVVDGDGGFGDVGGDDDLGERREGGREGGREGRSYLYCALCLLLVVLLLLLLLLLLLTAARHSA